MLERRAFEHKLTPTIGRSHGIHAEPTTFGIKLSEAYAEFSRAIALGATAIIIVHNHPSGDPTPSQQDIRLTRDLIEAGRHMKIQVHDHVIVGASGRTSMRAMGLM